MASGKSLELEAFSQRMRWRVIPRPTKVERDRTLIGKDRVRNRKYRNKLFKSSERL